MQACFQGHRKVLINLAVLNEHLHASLFHLEGGGAGENFNILSTAEGHLQGFSCFESWEVCFSADCIILHTCYV